MSYSSDAQEVEKIACKLCFILITSEVFPATVMFKVFLVQKGTFSPILKETLLLVYLMINLLIKI